MPLIRINNAIDDDIYQTNSVEMMASWQLWLASGKPFIDVISGSNSLKVSSNAFFTLQAPFRWYRSVQEDLYVTQNHLDVGGNFKDDTRYQLYLVDEENHPKLMISEDVLKPLNVHPDNALWIAQFTTKANGIIDPTSLVDSQSTKAGDLWAIGAPYVQYPNLASPEDLYPRQQWQEISEHFAGDFFRVVGGQASAFGSGRQAESLPNIIGEWGLNQAGIAYAENATDLLKPKGAIYASKRAVHGATSAGTANDQATRLGFDASLSCPSYGRREELAPQNHSIRLWVKRA